MHRNKVVFPLCHCGVTYRKLSSVSHNSMGLSTQPCGAADMQWFIQCLHSASYRFWKGKGMCLSDSNLTVWALVHCKLGIPVSFFPMHHIQQQQLSDMQTTIHHSLTFQLGCVPILYHFGVIYTLQSEDLCFFHTLHVLASFLHLKRKKKKKKGRRSSGTIMQI